MKARTIILTVGIVLGLVYGAVSAFQNQNPYAHTVNMDAASHWQPSAVWLPSYLFCRFPPNGLGITHSKSGYVFNSPGHRMIYSASSAVLGGVMGCLAGCAATLLTPRKKKTVEPARAANE